MKLTKPVEPISLASQSKKSREKRYNEEKPYGGSSNSPGHLTTRQVEGCLHFQDQHLPIERKKNRSIRLALMHSKEAKRSGEERTLEIKSFNSFLE